MAVEREIILNVQTGQAAKSINDLKNNIKKLSTELSNLDEGNDRFDQALKELVESQQALNEVNKEVEDSIKGTTEAQNQNATTVKELQAEISRYRDKLVDLDSSSKEYADAVSEITTREEKLSEVKNAGRKVVEKQITETARLQSEIKDYKDQLLTLDSSSKEYINTLQQISARQTQLNKVNQDARNISLTLEQQLNNVVKVGGTLAAGFSSVSAITQLFGSNTEELSKVMVKLQAGIALVQGVKGLTGLQATIPALITGIKSVTVSVRGLSGAIAATGIGAFAIALGLVVSAIYSFTSETDVATTAIDNANKAIQRENDLLEDSEKSWNRYIQRRKAAGATELEIIEETKKRTERQLKELPGRTVKVFDELEVEYNKALEKINNTFYFWGTKRLMDRKELAKKFKEARKEANDKAVEDYKKFNDKIKDLDEQEKLDKIKRQTKSREDAEKEAARRRESELKEIDQINIDVRNANLSSYDLQLTDLREAYERQLTLLQSYGKDTTDLTIKYYAEVKKVVREEEERISGERVQAFSKEVQQLKDSNDLKLQQNELYLEELDAQKAAWELKLIEEGGSDEEIEARIAETEQRITEARDAQSLANIEFLEEYSQLLQTLLEDNTLVAEDRVDLEKDLQNTLNQIELAGVKRRKSILDDEIKNQKAQAAAADDILKKKQTQEKAYYDSSAQLLDAASQLLGQQTAAGKALAIASATISTYAGAAQVLSDPTTPNPYIKWANFATTIATGLGAVKNITSVDVPAASSSTSVSTPSVSEYVQAPTPNMDTITPEINPEYTDLDSTEQRQLNTRVYVLESDIRDTTNMVNVTIDEKNFSRNGQ